MKSANLSRRQFSKLLSTAAIGSLAGSAARSASPSAAQPRDQRRPNVLFFIADDLRPMLGCYGAPTLTPHIDALASRGVVFDRAYCQVSLCCPSRSSLFTGVRPEVSRIFDNSTHFRVYQPAAITLPELFRLNGYHSTAMGKIYHSQWDHAYVGRTLDDPASWSDPAWFPPVVQFYFTPEGERAAREVYAMDPHCRLHQGGLCVHNRLRTTGKPSEVNPSDPRYDEWPEHFIMGLSSEAPNVEDSRLYDGQVADHAVSTLRQLKDRNEPFFLSVGFTRPHIPYVAPKRYWDLYDPATIRVAANPSVPEGAPAWALPPEQDDARYFDFPSGKVSDAFARKLIHGYMACVSYIDAQMGRVLGELNRLGLAEDTIVVLTADHGMHLGENGRWGKQTCFETANRVPLIISTPGKAGNGRTAHGLVESVDIYPTLCELAGVAPLGKLQGRSAAPLLDNPDQPWKAAAFSQFPRPDRPSLPTVKPGNDDVMGYAMRTDRYRYIEWRYITRPTEIAARELYDYADGPLETVNLASHPDRAKLVESLHRQLAAGWRGV